MNPKTIPVRNTSKLQMEKSPDGGMWIIVYMIAANINPVIGTSVTLKNSSSAIDEAMHNTIDLFFERVESGADKMFLIKAICLKFDSKYFEIK
jgi:hypothetical protein